MDIETVLHEKRTERFSVCLADSLKRAVVVCATLSGTSVNDHIATVLARDAALQGVIGVNSCDWDDLENSIRRSLVIARGIRAGSNGNRRIA